MNLDPIQEAAKAQFARQSANYGKGHTLENIEDVIAAAARMTLPPRARLLDVAAANGHTGLYFASLGHNVVLADIAGPMLDRARELAAERGLTVETREHPAEAMPYPNASFDLVACRVAAHHFSSPEAFVRESARVLKPGAWFLLIDNSAEDGNPVAEEWIHQIDKLHDPSHVRALTPNTWKALCAAAALEVQSAELHPFKQPNLEWYFDTSATPPENRRKARELIAHAPEEARRAFRLAEEPDGNVTWEWPRLTLIARKG
jgi:ubiquinone/menaquinone biosynthesis C-methylase UbiE